MQFRLQILPLLLLIALVVPASGQTDIPPLGNDSREFLTDLPAVKGTEALEVPSLQDKPLLVTFFASWCPPCRKEFSHLNDLYERYKNTDLRIIAINVHEAWDENDESRMKEFIDSTSPEFPTLAGSEEVRELFGGISRIPTIYGYNRKGEHVYRFVHRRNSSKTNATYDELVSAADELLQAE